MSQPASARVLPHSRAGRSGGGRPATGRPAGLRMVSAPAAGHGGLMLLCLGLLLGSFIAVLLLNISMAKGSFVLNDLQHESNVLTDTDQALRHALDAQSAPAELAKRALDLGMVPSSTAAFLRLSDGKILGVAEPAEPTTAFTVVAQGPQPRNSTEPAKPGTPEAPVQGTTVTREGTVTTTTVVQIRGDRVDTTVTSYDSATGRTTSTTTTKVMPPPDPAASPAPTASATPGPEPSPSASPAAR